MIQILFIKILNEEVIQQKYKFYFLSLKKQTILCGKSN